MKKLNPITVMCLLALSYSTAYGCETISKKTESQQIIAQACDDRQGGGPFKKHGQNCFIALLLDTSNSMDGLINQAKAQLMGYCQYEFTHAKCGNDNKTSIYKSHSIPIWER